MTAQHLSYHTSGILLNPLYTLMFTIGRHSSFDLNMSDLSFLVTEFSVASLHLHQSEKMGICYKHSSCFSCLNTHAEFKLETKEYEHAERLSFTTFASIVECNDSKKSLLV